MNCITVKSLCKSFGSVEVLKDISFNVEKGDSFYIVGENGSGKTTLIKLLLGLAEPNFGSIEVNGFSKNQIGYLPQQTDIQADFPASATEVVLSGFLNRNKKIFGYSAGEKRIAAEHMERLGVADIAKKSFRELSGGQKQRVLLCRALCASGGVLLLDEPLTGLDPLATAEFYEVLEELNQKGFTVIMISHDVQCAVRHGNKILHLGHGEWFFGTSAEYEQSPLGKKMLFGGHHHD